MITIIQFDKLGRPSWRDVDTGQLAYREARQALEFSEFEKAWFKKPLTERSK